MAFLVVSFLAGALTVLAPCILPLLPVVIGASASGRSKFTPFIVVGSLSLSILVFTYLLKASTALITIPPYVWTYLSGGILFFFGLTLLFPSLWERIPGIAKLSALSNKAVGSGYKKKTVWGDALIGAALGPVFSTCSPTYFVILASVLPASFLLGTTYLLAYIAGLALVLLLIAFLGQSFADRLTGISDSKGWLKRGFGVLFIVLGLMIATGIEKKIETAILESGYFDVTKIEQQLLQWVPDDTSSHETNPMNKEAGTPYIEIAGATGYVNTEPITLGELVGKKVILLDFMTYSCINCQRTFPYLASWYEKYSDEGLEIVGIHTPEFAFEKDIDHVEKAMAEFGLEFPVVLDNDYATWRAYGNLYWPRKYLIDIHGNIVYDHIGEGAYDKTENKIRELLSERAMVLGEVVGPDAQKPVAKTDGAQKGAGSPETYFGSLRNTLLSNGNAGRAGVQTFTLPTLRIPNALYLSGTWNITEEYARSVADAGVVFQYRAKTVYMVARADTPVALEVYQDGVLIGSLTIEDSKLYTLIENTGSEAHELMLKAKGAGLEVYTFTFG
jgi:cytochrome c biogenesis protein CcdA/thiol-disulfide isomerase/thioredoxin